MSDIVERLRRGHHNADLVTVGGVTHDGRCLVAADEITRLRAENAALTRAMREAWMAVECADRAHGEKCPEFSSALIDAKLAFEVAMDRPDPLGKALADLAAVERERDALMQKHRFADLHVEALAEIKATVDGNSDQSIKDIIDGLLAAINARAALEKPHG